jgi:hypothetical protein
MTCVCMSMLRRSHAMAVVIGLNIFLESPSDVLQETVGFQVSSLFYFRKEMVNP